MWCFFMCTIIKSDGAHCLQLWHHHKISDFWHLLPILFLGFLTFVRNDSLAGFINSIATKNTISIKVFSVTFSIYLILL